MSVRTLVAAALVTAAACAVIGQEKKDDAKKDEKKNYKPGDMSRPRPRVIDPGTTTAADVPGRPPADATVLFDGKSLRDEWAHSGRTDADAELKWKVENGYAEVKGGSIQTKRRFGDSQVHIEWAAPKEVKGNGQGRGNSGVYLGGFGEVQVLDSFNNDTYPDGQAAALYNRFPPLVNASRKPGEWQAYDIIAQLPKVDDTGKVVRPGRITVLHNGIVAHHAVEFGGKFGEFSILLQDHGNPVRYRNIWVRKLGEYDDGTPPPQKK
ncbi:MAG: DUF1080 domain-containing protein [Gemmata sp.]|jgi:hypothetical protein